jgi:hypothetical protein
MSRTAAFAQGESARRMEKQPSYPRDHSLPRRPSAFLRSNWAPLACLAFFLMLGTYLRTAVLGQGDFGVDELFQVYAAQGLLETGEPRLPSGEAYRRGYDVTRLVAWSFERHGISEYAARLPSAAFGVLGLFLFAAIVWALGGPWAAVVGTALLAVYPEAVRQSREVRFYTYQMTFGMLALYTGWRALARGAGRVLPDRRSIVAQWGWMLVTLVLLLLATRVQVVSLSVAAGWSVCVLLAAVHDLHVRRKQAWRYSVPLQAVAVGAVVLALILAASPGVISEVITQGRYIPGWIERAEGGTTPLAYYYSLSDTYPLLLGLLPAIFIAAILRTGRLGIYLAVWFSVPLLLHSLVLVMKGARFILTPMLGLFVAAAIAAVWLAELLHFYVRRRAGAAGMGNAGAWYLGTACILGVALAAYVTMPALHRSRKLVGEKSTRWSNAAVVLHSRPELAALPIGQTQALHPLYYWGRIDFVLGEPGRREAAEHAAQPVESRAGAPILHTPEEVRAHFAGAGAVLIGLDLEMLAAGRVDRRLADALQESAEELCQRRCGRMQLYYWRFAADRETDPHPILRE